MLTGSLLWVSTRAQERPLVEVKSPCPGSSLITASVPVTHELLLPWWDRGTSVHALQEG